MQEHRGTGARERVCGDIVRLGSLEAGGWCRRWQALCEVPVRAYRVDGVADGKLFARYPCAHTGWMVSQMANPLRGTRARMQDGWTTDGKLSARYPKTGWMDNRWQTLCEVREYKCGKVWIPRVSVHVVCALCLCTLSVHVVCALHLCTSSVHFIFALHLCTLSVHVVCALHLCTSSMHVVCALWLIPAGRAAIVPLAEDTLAIWRLPVAIVIT